MGWDSERQRAHVEAFVKACPRQEGEHFLAYLHRIAVGSGLMREAEPESATREPGQEG